MGIFVNPGNSGFQSALRSKIYIDKTGLLEYTNSVLGSEQRYICVSRPRRFGKSMTAEMLVAYYDKSCNSEDMFGNLKISDSADFKKYLNQYPVIHVDVNVFLHRRDKKNGGSVTAVEAVGLFHSEVIEELRKIYPNAIRDREDNLPSALAQIHETTRERFVVIIDEWDAIFREDKLDIRAQEAYIDLLRGLFKDAGAKRFIELAYLTGILPIKKYGTESALNNFDEFSMIQAEPLSTYVGFTEEEVQALCTTYNMEYDEINRWYDGYVLTKGLHIYNPKSVIDSILRKQIANYWTRTETYESLKNYINMNFDGLKDSIVQMLLGQRCKVNTSTFSNDMTSFDSRDDILTVLIHLGYLAYDTEHEEVYIPNQEVREAFSGAIQKSGWKAVTDAIVASDQLLKDTWHMNEKAVEEALARVHRNNTSILQYNDENSLSCVITLAYYNAISEYTLIREMPTGKGYADIVFLPHKDSDKPAMIVELKYDKSVESALAQIKNKQYSAIWDSYTGDVLLVGINYNKKSKMYDCRIEKVTKMTIGSYEK